HLLALSNRPSAAFKDIAMQLLGNLFEGKRLKILGATSGDTGTAAEYALRGKSGIEVFMLSPWKRMTPFQAAQMYSLQDPNIHNIAVRGVFDDCQDLVKKVNADAAFKQRNRIGAVNSINWARVAAQVVYYFKGYFAATHADNEQVSFAVPSGNFGNVYAGYVSGRSRHPDRLATIRAIYTKYGVMIDPHSADGVHVGLQYREPGVPLLCLETALPVKFAETIREALGREPVRPAEFAALEE